MKHLIAPHGSHLITAILLGLAAPAGAQHAHGHAVPAPLGIEEPGQGAFAAITEIVTLLRADPATDWTTVDITGLRAHLVDMSDLITLTRADVVQTPTGVRITLDLARPENAAAGRMVPAHAPVLATQTGWHSTVSQTGSLLIWDITSQTDAPVIAGLGFFGLMAVGDHHRAHHLALARGKPAH